MALELNDSIFEEKVLKSDKPVLVDFWAEWCGPCRMVGPIIDELSKDYEGKALVGKIDVDANQEFAAKFGVRNIPTVLLFKDCINYTLDIKGLNLNESNKYCNCTLRILITKFDSKKEAEESLIKNITSNSIYEPCEKY